MTRAEYLAELDSHLITLPREEREMAVRFYEEYFDEAGPEKEQEVIDELGKPYNLAKSIIGETSLYNKSDVYINYKASKPMPKNNTDVFVSLQKPGAFADQPADTTEDIMPKRAGTGAAAQKQDTMPRSGHNSTEPDPNIHFYGANASSENSNEQNQEQKSDNQNNNSNNEGNTSGMFDQYYNKGYEKSSDNPYGKNYTPYSNKKPVSAGKIIFWVLMTIFVIIPFILPLAIVMIIVIPIVMLAIGLVAAVCIVTAVIAIIAGIIKVFTSIPAAIGLAAAGLLAAGIGFMMLSAALAFFFRFLPWVTKKITGFYRRRTEQ